MDMTKETETLFGVRSKIWIEDSSGEVIFGLGRLKMLEAIQRQGSIQAAAKELKMSYRAIWGRITATESRIGRQLLIRNIGGSQASFDKQFVRDYLLSIAWNQKPPAPHLPESVIEGTRNRYLEALNLLAGPAYAIC